MIYEIKLVVDDMSLIDRIYNSEGSLELRFNLIYTKHNDSIQYSLKRLGLDLDWPWGSTSERRDKDEMLRMYMSRILELKADLIRVIGDPNQIVVGIETRAEQ